VQAVMVHVNVGTANAICGLINGWRCNIPVLFTAGRTPYSEEGVLMGMRSGEIHWPQEMRDQRAMVREFVKWDYELPNGEVLAAGGFGSFGALTSAELYDPAPVSQITPAGTTCSQFSSDTAETLGSVQYIRKNGLVDRVLPRSFLYWVPVTAPAGDNVFRITQTITTGNFDTFFAGIGNRSSVFDSNCVTLQRTVRQRGNTATVNFNAPAAGTYFIAIAFDARSLVGEPAPHPTTVHYEFTTTGVPHSTSGLDLVKD